MTIDISANNPRISYSVASGVTQTSFTVPFEFFDDSDLNVYIDTTLQTITTNYTVAGGAGSTGTITMSVTGPKTVILTRDTTIERTTDFTAGVDINRAALNTQLDTLTAISADNKDFAERSIRITDYDPAAANLLLPDAATRADKLLSFDTEGDVSVQAAADLLTGSVLGANYTKASYTGDGTQTAYSTVESAGSKNNIQVYVDGVYQNKVTFSISGATLTFTEAPPLNSAIEFIVGNAVTSLTTDPDVVTYNQGGTGAQDRTLTSKLQDTVSVKDFGAVGDGVADDTAAIQAAMDALSDGNALFFPKGRYVVSSTINCTREHFRLFGESSPSQVTSNQQEGSVLEFSQTTTAGIIFDDDAAVTTNSTRRIAIENMGFVGSTTSSILQFNDAPQINIENVFVDNQTSGSGYGIDFNRCFLISTKNVFVFKSANERATDSIGIRLALDDPQLAGIYNLQSTTVRGWGTGLKIDGSYTSGGNQRWQSFNWHGSQTKSNSVGMDLVGNIQSGTILGSYFEGDISSSLRMSQGVENFLVAGNFFNSSSTSGQINVGLSTSTNEGFVRNITMLSNNHTNIDDRGVYIRANDTFASGIKVENCYFEEASGATSTIGISVGGNPTTTRIQSCSFGTIDTKISNDENALYVDDVDGHFIRPVNVETITGALTLTADSPRIQSIDCDPTNRTVVLPAKSVSQGKEFLITNTGSSNDLIVKDSTETTTVVTITGGNSALVWNDGTDDYGKVL